MTSPGRRGNINHSLLEAKGGKEVQTARGGRCYRLLAGTLVIWTGACGVQTTPLLSGDGETFLGSAALGDAELSVAAAAPACVEVDAPAGDVQAAMWDALNAYRVEAGLNPLIYSKTLEAAAETHLKDLYERGYFAHENPEGEHPGDRALDVGFCHRYVGENLAAGQKTLDRAMRAWIESPSHNENMLDDRYVYVGMGYYEAPTGRRYWAQEFALDMP